MPPSMRTLVKLMLMLGGGYAASIVTGAIVWSLGSGSGLSVGAFLYCLWLILAFLLFPTSTPAIAAHAAVIGLAMLAAALRKQGPSKHLLYLAGLGGATGAIFIWLWAAPGERDGFLISVATLPLIATGLAMALFVRVLFKGENETSEPVNSVQMAARRRRTSVTISILLLPPFLAAVAWLVHTHRERQDWNRVEDALRRVVLTDERFPHVKVARARNGSAFLFGSVESSKKLRDLYAVLENAKLERVPQISVTVYEPPRTTRTAIQNPPP